MIALDGFTICQSVEQDDDANVTALKGLFNNIESAGFPTRLPDGWLVGQVYGIRHQTELVLRFVYLDPIQMEPTEIWKRPMPARPCEDVRLPMSILLHIGGDTLPGPGEYRFELWHDDREVGHKKFFASLLRNGT